MREVVAEAEADHDGISRVTALLILPQALAYQGDASAARAAAEGAIESAAELGDVYIGAVYIEVMFAHLAAGDVALASEAAEAAWSHMRDLQGQLSSTTRLSPRRPWRAVISPGPDAGRTMPSR